MFSKLIEIADAFDGNDIEYVANTECKKTLTIRKDCGDVLLSIFNTRNNVGACIRYTGNNAYWLYFNDFECSVEGCVAFIKDCIIEKAIREFEYIIDIFEMNGIDFDSTLKQMKKNSINKDSFIPAYEKLVYQKDAYKVLKPFWM